MSAENDEKIVLNSVEGKVEHLLIR